MVDITLHIVAPELTAAINNLADSMKNRPVAAPTAPVTVAPVQPDNSPAPVQTPAEAPVTAPANVTPINAPVTDAVNGGATVPTAAPAPASVTAPAPANTAISDPVPAPDPVQAPAERVYTMDDIKNAGSQLLAAGKMEQLMELLQKNYNVQAVTQLKPDQYAAMVDDLRKLGAKV